MIYADATSPQQNAFIEADSELMLLALLLMQRLLLLSITRIKSRLHIGVDRQEQKQASGP